MINKKPAESKRNLYLWGKSECHAVHIILSETRQMVNQSWNAQPRKTISIPLISVRLQCILLLFYVTK